MGEFDTPAVPQPVLDAPALDDGPSEVTTVRTDTLSAADQIEAAAAVDAAFKQLKAQPKVRIRVPKVMGPQVVNINGARFNVPANVYVDVPQQVAEVLADAGRI